jgi:hypothetical protein
MVCGQINIRDPDLFAARYITFVPLLLELLGRVRILAIAMGLLLFVVGIFSTHRLLQTSF